MKIFDCFMYFDEEVVLDLRLNTLNEYVDYFVIVESVFTHRGDKRNLIFNHKKFEKFKDKIIYLVFDQEPNNIEKVFDEDSQGEKSRKLILNAALRENGQRNFILNGLNNAADNDLILISDVDEIPDLKNLDLEKINQKIILFKQDMFYYKFNLKLPNLIWTGTKACKKKYLNSPQWLRNIKDKKYPFFRLDVFFSKTKYIDIKFINDGGWHFSNIKTAAEIEYKLKSYLHHREFDVNPMSKNEINEIIKNKQAIYDLKVDKRINKIGNGSKLEKYPLDKLPKFLKNNLNKYKDWID
jgi:beta-1,4-mannosyl-glycoprotein beta-1,4-N-acetylglucosaminyltransferase